MSFPRGGTPTFVLRLKNSTEDLTQAETIVVSIVAGYVNIVKTGADITVLSATEIEVFLTQEESLSLCSTTANIMVNWTYPGEIVERWATKKATVEVDEQLYTKAIGGGGA